MGRFVKSNRAAAKLTPEDVRLIRQIHEDGKREKERWSSIYTCAAIAKKFDISQRTVQNIIEYRYYRHVL